MSDPRPNPKDIVCKTCAHGKHWHPNEGPCRAPEGPGWDCDCEAWLYGANIFDLPIPEEDEFEDIRGKQ